MRISPRAKRLHDECIIVDGHNDHLILKWVRGEPFDFMKVNRRYHSDGPRLRKGGMTATMFMVDGHHLDRSMSMIEQTLEEIEDNPDDLMLVTKTADIRAAKRTGRLGVMMTWESLLALQEDIDLLHIAHRLGIRASTLTHGEGGMENALQLAPSEFGYCSAADREMFRKMNAGLTLFGRETVMRMNALGILIDVAHANDCALYDIIEITTRPVISSHGGVFALSPHSRCSTDDQIRAIAATGGLLSIAFFGAFIAEKDPSVDKIVDQIAYVVDLVGVDHVGVGTDFDGLPDGEFPVIPSADELPQLTEAMVRRGFSDAEIKKIWGGNYLRVLKATIG